ncbi:GSCFA domain-containing protein [Carboxylicivirga caseinilyticus]|uniref:GSCFA domain-containing protein n=1 Tax=Carboxylicivirga caseinilyticus TaxID=3417572 RepID=UPI003D34A3A9|nr:GSCFA domain-containing protein [Marinilabiliaceae bacterium A049]
METFRTVVDVPHQQDRMSYDSQLLFMGSCFANNIGSYFTETGFNALVNPFGVLYNPFSISESINRLISNKKYELSDLISHNDQWQSFDFHSQFNHTNKEQCLQNINDSLKKGTEVLHNADYLLLTFGTAWIYQLKDSEKVVSNCHKFPASHFSRSLLSVEQITETYSQLIKQLKAINSNLTIILTVSPVRHWKDGAHGNQISKATLLLSIEKLCSKFDHLFYFPAYEILLDDLRDYRFFDSDMLHPSKEAIDYIRSKFISSWIDDKGLDFIQRMEKIKKAASHKPFDPNSAQHQKFIKQQIAGLEQIQKKFNNVTLSYHIEVFNKQLNKTVKSHKKSR